MAKEWLTLSGLGVLFGFFPLFWCFGGSVACAVLLQDKEVPSWLLRLATIDPRTRKVRRGWLPLRYAHLGHWIMSTPYVVAVLGIEHWLLLEDYTRGYVDVIDIVTTETSFTLFLVLTWLLPTYFLGRYLKKLKPRGVKGPE